MPTEDEQDRAAMARLNAGEDRALGELMERHAGKLRQYVFRQVQNDAEALDITQETFVRIHQNRHRYDPSKKFSTWAYTIATNLVRNAFRWRGRHRAVSLDAKVGSSEAELALMVPDEKLTPSERAVQEERVQTIRKAVAELPEDLRTPLLLAEFEDHSQAEIAEILNCSSKAVEMRIYRARQQLRKALGKLLA